MELKAIRVSSDADVDLCEVDLPATPAGTLLLKTHYVGICGTDLGFITKQRKPIKTNPLTLGHEIVSSIYSLNDSTNINLKVGDRVTVQLMAGCERCSDCLSDYKLGCISGERIGITVNGGYAEYVSVPIANVCKLPYNVSFEQGVFADPLSCAYKAIQKIIGRTYKNVLIFGGGVIGIFCLQLLRHYSIAQNITIFDRHVERLQVASEWDTINVSNDYVMPDRYFDLVIEASGSTELFLQGIKSLKSRGTILLIGLHQNREIPINTFELLQKDCAIIASLAYGKKDMEASLDLLSQRRISVDKLSTKIFPLSSFKDAFESAIHKRVMKVIFSTF